MSEQQQRLSRFGFSWFSALRHALRPQPSQPHEGAIAIQRPPFHPAGKAPTQPFTSWSEAQQKSENSARRASAEKAPTESSTSESQAQPENETPTGNAPGQPSPSQSQAMQKSITQTPVASPTSQTRGISKPSSEPRSATPPQTASVPSSQQLRASQSQQSSREGHSPSHLASEPSGQKKMLASTSWHPSNRQPWQIAEAVPESPSPLKTEQSPTEESPKPSPGSAQPSRATSQEAAEATVLQALLQEIKPTADTKSEEEGNPLTSQKPPQELKPKAEFKVELAITTRKKEEVNLLASQKPVQQLNSKAESKVEPAITSWKQEEGNPSASQRPTQELKSMAESKDEPASISKSPSPIATSQTDSGTGKPSRIPSPVGEEATNHKSDSETSNGEKLNSKLGRKLEKTEEKCNIVREQIKEEAEGTNQDNEKWTEKTFAPQSTLVSGKKTNDLTSKIQGQKFQEKNKSGKEKKVSSPKGLEVKNLSSTSDQSKGINNVHARSHQRPQASDVQNACLHKATRENIPKYLPKTTMGNSRKLLMDEKSVAGQNKVATMHVDSSSRKVGLFHIRRGYKRRAEEGPEAITDGGDSEGRKSRYQDSKEDSPSIAYINSSIQSFNNSLLFSSSVDERKPGVHFALFSKQQRTSSHVMM